MFVARLVGPDGALKYRLGGQLDVTEMLGREEDLVNVLKYVSPRSDGPPATASSDEQDERASWRADHSERRPERGWEPQSKYPPSASLNGFLKSFRRKHSFNRSLEPDNNADTSSAEPSTPTRRRDSTQFPNSSAACSGMPVVSPFSRYMVLQYVKPSSPRIDGHRQEKYCAVELPVAFCSKATLDMFGGGKYTSADVLGFDVFDVLSEKAGASISKSFKQDVRDSLARSRTAHLGMKLRGGRPRRSRGISLSRKPSIVGSSGTGEPFDHGRPSRSSFSRERLLPKQQYFGSG